MITPLAPAAAALAVLRPKVQGGDPAGVPRWIRAMSPSLNPVKSAAVQPRISPLGLLTSAVVSPLPEQVMTSKSTFSAYVTELGAVCAKIAGGNSWQNAK